MASDIAHWLPEQLRWEREIHSSPRSIIASCWNEEGAPRVVKFAPQEIPTSQQLEGLRFEHRRLRLLRGPGVVQVEELLEYEGRLFLVMKDRQLRPWSEAVGAVEPEALLRGLIAVAQSLAEIHQKGYLHNGLSPAHILSNEAMDEIELIDLSASTKIATEAPLLRPHAVPIEQLLYSSPEQTGRIHRSLDARSELYSLGATAWHMWVGQPPFRSDDPEQLLFAHLASEAPEPQLLRPQLPEGLSKILMKMMAKRPEQRYQSIAGLLWDLQQVLEGFRAGGGPSCDETFEVGLRDFSPQFRIPARVYGRQREKEALLGAFARVRKGTASLLLVSGPPGIGKTSLVQMLHQQVLEAQGYFVTGTFEQQHEEAPFRAFFQALRKLLQELLTLESLELELWRSKISSVMEGKAGLWQRELPELSYFLSEDEPDAPAPLQAQEARNRAYLLFGALLRILASPRNPLVLFLDDFQRADSDSLALLEYITTDLEFPGLMLIVGVRDNELDADHPFTGFLERLAEQKVPVQRMKLGPLSQAAVESMLADTCRCEPEETGALAALLLEKTAGNPFFLRSLLHQLHHQGLFREKSPGWGWDLEAIQRAQVTDNVVELMVERFAHFGPDCREALALAALLGKRFAFEPLCELLGWPQQRLEDALAAAIEEGVLAVFGESYTEPAYRFVHDRVQEAAYSLFDDRQQATWHRSIGRRLLEREQADPPEAIFAIVGHLGKALEVMPPGERDEFAKLAHLAGQKAEASAAAEGAFAYYERGLQALGDNRWTAAYETCFALSYASARTGFLAHQKERMEQLLDEILEGSTDPYHKCCVWHQRLKAAIDVNQLPHAAEIYQEFCQHVGLPPLQRSSAWTVFKWLARCRWSTRKCSPEALLELPLIEDPYEALAMDMHSQVGLAYGVLDPSVVIELVYRGLVGSVRAGWSSSGAQAWLFYGVILATRLRRRQLGIRYADLALERTEQLGLWAEWPRLASLHALLILPLRSPVAEILEQLRKIARASLDTGDLYSASSAVGAQVTLLFFYGYELAVIEDFIQRTEAQQHPAQLRTRRAYYRFFHNAVGLLRRDAPPDGPQDIARVNDQDDDARRFSRPLVELQLQLVFGHWEEGARCMEEAIPLLGSSTVIFILAPFWNYGLVALYLLAEQRPLSAASRRLLRKGRRQLAFCCEQLYGKQGYRLTWVEAMSKFASKDRLEVLGLFDRAIREARRSGARQDAAMIAEQAAIYCEKNQLERVFESYLQEAVAGYRQWGAAAKVAQLHQSYPQLIPQPQSLLPAAAASWQWRQDDSSLDLEKVREATLALGNEKRTPRLARQILQLVLEFSGAQRAWLLLKYGEQWRIAAQSSLGMELVESPDQPISLDDDRVPFSSSMVRYVSLTRQNLVLHHASKEGPFLKDPYVQREKPSSVTCIPLHQGARMVGALYLENNLAPGQFTPEIMEALAILARQAAVALERSLPTQTPPRSGPSTPPPRTLDDSGPSEASPNYRDPTLWIGHTLAGAWRIERLLGKGGMALVFEACHQIQGLRAAIKILRPDSRVSSHQIRRFRREAQTLSSLQHPHIIKVFETGEDPVFGFYIVLELLQGGDFSMFLEQAPLPLRWLLPVVEQICLALEAIHQEGIVHRDLKPSNLFLLPHHDAPQVKLLDFGVAQAQLYQDETRLTATGALLGTPAYLAPEQLKENAAITPATDIYALGVLLFETLTREHPLGAGSPIELFVKTLQQQPRSLGSLRPEFRGTLLEELLLRTLAKSPSQRPPSAWEFWLEFETACLLLEDPGDDPSFSAQLPLELSPTVEQESP